MAYLEAKFWIKSQPNKNSYTKQKFTFSNLWWEEKWVRHSLLVKIAAEKCCIGNNIKILLAYNKSLLFLILSTSSWSQLSLADTAKFIQTWLQPQSNHRTPTYAFPLSLYQQLLWACSESRTWKHKRPK